VAKLARATIGSIIRNTGGTRLTVIGEPRTSSAARLKAKVEEALGLAIARVASGPPVVPAVRAASVVPGDPVELAVPAALAVPEDLVELAVQAELVVPEDPVELAVQAALVVSERLAVQGALVVPEDPAVPVALERDLVQVEAELVRDRPRVQLAVPLKTKSAIALHPRGLHPLLAAAEDLAAAVAEITLAPAAAEAVIAWEVADIVAAEVAVVVAEAAVAVAVEDAEDKETNCE